MATNRQILDKLNEIVATERRQGALYRMISAMMTGPYREALSGEFKDHAETEDKHAELAMHHVMAMGGDLTNEIKEIPVWRNLDEALRGLEKYEEDGVALWQELMRMLPANDAFRHVIESILEREQEHVDDSKRWLRTDFAEKSMKNYTGDIGSIVPLNMRMRQQTMIAPAIKSVSHEERIWSDSRAGTPPTRRGAINGVMPSTLPNAPASLNPTLYLGKAVTDPGLAGGGVKDTTPRKRDPKTGKFTQAPITGPQSTAEEDVSAAARTAKLAERRYGTKSVASKAMDVSSQSGIQMSPPGSSNPLAGGKGGQNMSPPIGNTPDGMPVYSDPYHASHEGFSADQHQAAADLHNQLAEIATNSGRIPTALDHQLKARIHGDLANDSKSPMERMLSRQGMPGSARGEANNMPKADNNDALDSFLSQLPDVKPGEQNQNPDQNKPTIGSPSQIQGPLPRMSNTRTGSPIGPQSQSFQHAGTVEQPQEMPDEPDDGSSMPNLAGPSVSLAADTDDLDSPYAYPSSIPKEDYAKYVGKYKLDMSDKGDEDADDDSEAPESNAGSSAFKLKTGGPTPGSTDSEPGDDAGPSTQDKKLPVNAQKSFTDWFSKI